MQLAVIGFILMLVLMYVLIREKLSPPVAFILLPLIAAVVAGCNMEAIAGFIKDGMATMLSTAILFIFSISYFTLMSDAGLFDPIINFLIKRTGKGLTTIFLAIVLTTFVAHLDGSGATTFLIVVPAFLPICKKSASGPRPFRLHVWRLCNDEHCSVGWAYHACSVSSRYRSRRFICFYRAGVIAIALMAFVIAYIVSKIEKRGAPGLL
ncbi:MAG: SLC13 family permease [Enterocloster bolteae]